MSLAPSARSCLENHSSRWGPERSSAGAHEAMALHGEQAVHCSAVRRGRAAAATPRQEGSRPFRDRRQANLDVANGRRTPLDPTSTPDRPQHSPARPPRSPRWPHGFSSRARPRGWQEGHAPTCPPAPRTAPCSFAGRGQEREGLWSALRMGVRPIAHRPRKGAIDSSDEHLQIRTLKWPTSWHPEIPWTAHERLIEGVTVASPCISTLRACSPPRTLLTSAANQTAGWQKTQDLETTT